MGVNLQDIDGSKASSLSFTLVYILKLYSRLCHEDLHLSISRSFTPVYILKHYYRLYPEVLLSSIS
jgi:hypothetical protein